MMMTEAEVHILACISIALLVHFADLPATALTMYYLLEADTAFVSLPLAIHAQVCNVEHMKWVLDPNCIFSQIFFRVAAGLDTS